MNRLLSLFLLLFMLSTCSEKESKNLAPEIEMKLIDGSDFKLSSLKGNYVLLDFWGSWCGPCLADMPELVALHEKFGDQVVFVSIAFEKDDRRWRSVTKKFGMDWKHQAVEHARVLLASSIARDYGVTNIPAKFIVTPDGELISGLDFVQMEAYFNASLAIQ